MLKLKPALALFVVTLALTACGLKGPLYLPGEEPPRQPASEKGADDIDADGGGSAG